MISFFYGFFWGGISTKFYEFTLKKEIIARANPNPVFVLIIVFSSFILYMGLLGMFGFNSVDIYVGLMLLWVIVLVLGKRWLLRISIVSGLMMTALNICWYAVILFIYPGAIEDIWLTKYLSAVTLFNVPIEEHFYIFSLGCFGSIMYKAVTGTKRN